MCQVDLQMKPLPFGQVEKQQSYELVKKIFSQWKVQLKRKIINGGKNHFPILSTHN